jgi:hypothetical protein
VEADTVGSEVEDVVGCVVVVVCVVEGCWRGEVSRLTWGAGLGMGVSEVDRWGMFLISL